MRKAIIAIYHENKVVTATAVRQTALRGFPLNHDGAAPDGVGAGLSGSDEITALQGGGKDGPSVGTNFGRKAEVGNGCHRVQPIREEAHLSPILVCSRDIVSYTDWKDRYCLVTTILTRLLNGSRRNGSCSSFRPRLAVPA